MKSIFNFITGTVLTTVVYFLGGLDVALKTLLVFILLDYITGVCEAITKKKLNSIIGAKGIVKKIGYLIIVALSVQLDRITGETGAIRALVIYFFVANEGISILENWGSMGLPLPKVIIETLEQPATSLTESLKLYTQGVRILKECNDELDKVEKQLIILDGEEENV